MIRKEFGPDTKPPVFPQYHNIFHFANNGPARIHNSPRRIRRFSSIGGIGFYSIKLPLRYRGVPGWSDGLGHMEAFRVLRSKKKGWEQVFAVMGRGNTFGCGYWVGILEMDDLRGGRGGVDGFVRKYKLCIPHR
jgi:hypothetical protein